MHAPTVQATAPGARGRGNAPFLADAFDKGWLTPLNEANLPDYGDFPEEFLVRDGQTAVVSINPTVPAPSGRRTCAAAR